MSGPQSSFSGLARPAFAKRTAIAVSAESLVSEHYGRASACL